MGVRGGEDSDGVNVDDVPTRWVLGHKRQLNAFLRI